MASGILKTSTIPCSIPIFFRERAREREREKRERERERDREIERKKEKERDEEEEEEKDDTANSELSAHDWLVNSVISTGLLPVLGSARNRIWLQCNK